MEYPKEARKFYQATKIQLIYDKHSACFAEKCHEFMDNFTADDGKTIKYREMLVR